MSLIFQLSTQQGLLKSEIMNINFRLLLLNRKEGLCKYEKEIYKIDLETEFTVTKEMDELVFEISNLNSNE